MSIDRRYTTHFLRIPLEQNDKQFFAISSSMLIWELTYCKEPIDYHRTHMSVPDMGYPSYVACNASHEDIQCIAS